MVPADSAQRPPPARLAMGDINEGALRPRASSAGLMTLTRGPAGYFEGWGKRVASTAIVPLPGLQKLWSAASTCWTRLHASGSVPGDHVQRARYGHASAPAPLQGCWRTIILTNSHPFAPPNARTRQRTAPAPGTQERDACCSSHLRHGMVHGASNRGAAVLASAVEKGTPTATKQPPAAVAYQTRSCWRVRPDHRVRYAARTDLL